ncbi:hypothetical protein [Hymenobacter terrenus]|uniref:hypothetical protein n=1 Tax=Hymenobacter terrenus TaxID=1629124 RepID=UPI000A3F27C9|nr:hypothetical protein [Hymenobacter terrenus]
MRLHDTLMGRMDSLMSEDQRLHQYTARLDTTTATGQRQAARLRRFANSLHYADDAMMTWMHDFQKVDTVGLSAHQYADFWAMQQRYLRQIYTKTSAALDSSRTIR